MTKIQKLKIITLLSVFIPFLATVPVFAAEVSFESKTQTITIGQQFEVSVFINTDNEEINAIEGKIIFPQDLLEIKKINDGNSIINFWIDPVRNCVSNGVEKPDEICFSGIVPGGYNDSRGLIFSITFLAKKATASGGVPSEGGKGSGAIEFSGVKALRNDGKGTEAALTISNFQFLISNPPIGVPVPQITIPKTEDHNPPEEFTPQIAADPAIFGDKWFLVFATQDKGSGISHYEILEKREFKILNSEFGRDEWITGESPYVLKDQNLRSYIYVKAVDKAGNERIEMLSPKYPVRWYEYPLVWVIIILGIVIGYIIWRIKRKKLFSV